MSGQEGEVHLEHARDSDRARTVVHLVQREVRVITCDVQQICDHVSKHLLGRELVLATERAAVEMGHDRLYIKVDRQNFEARRLYDRLGYQLVYLQPRLDPRKGPPGANLFLRKDGLAES